MSRYVRKVLEIAPGRSLWMGFDIDGDEDLRARGFWRLDLLPPGQLEELRIVRWVQVSGQYAMNREFVRRLVGMKIKDEVITPPEYKLLKAFLSVTPDFHFPRQVRCLSFCETNFVLVYDDELPTADTFERIDGRWQCARCGGEGQATEMQI